MDDESKDLFIVCSKICGDYMSWRIVNALLLCEDGLSLRELARRVAVSPKALYIHLARLERDGIIKVVKPHRRAKLISIRDEYRWLRYAVNKIS